MRTKKFMYVLLAGALVASVVTKVSAKGGENGRLSIGAELALPMGTFGDAQGMGFGGSVRYEMPMGDNLGLMGTVGFLSFSGKDQTIMGFTVKGLSQTMIPIQVGAKYYFTEQQNGFYGSAELGIHMSSYTIPGTPAVMLGTVVLIPATADTKKTSSDLSFAPGVGYHLDNLDFGLKYQIISTTGSSSSYLGVRVAYVLGSK
jgi:hypothetical protein